jgi:transcriptional regulator
MYIPPAFNVAEIADMHAIIRASALPVLVSVTVDGLIATHAPLMLDPDAGPYGTLVGHLAKANPHAAASGVQTLVVFQGPEGYITPSYYAAKKEHGKVVPTWNYAAVHAYGALETFHDEDRLLGVVTRLTERHEAERAQPWAVTDAPADFVQGMLRAITGISIRIERLEGKVKMSQNRPAADRAGVAGGLRADGFSALSEAVARAAG